MGGDEEVRSLRTAQLGELLLVGLEDLGERREVVLGGDEGREGEGGEAEGLHCVFVDERMA